MGAVHSHTSAASLETMASDIRRTYVHQYILNDVLSPVVLPTLAPSQSVTEHKRASVFAYVFRMFQTGVGSVLIVNEETDANVVYGRVRNIGDIAFLCFTEDSAAPLQPGIVIRIGSPFNRKKK